jgi:hypothetical protein
MKKSYLVSDMLSTDPRLAEMAKELASLEFEVVSRYGTWNPKTERWE